MWPIASSKQITDNGCAAVMKDGDAVPGIWQPRGCGAVSETTASLRLMSQQDSSHMLSKATNWQKATCIADHV